MQGVWVWSLVEELGSHMPRGVATKQNKKQFMLVRKKQAIRTQITHNPIHPNLGIPQIPFTLRQSIKYKYVCVCMCVCVCIHIYSVYIYGSMEHSIPLHDGIIFI